MLSTVKLDGLQLHTSTAYALVQPAEGLESPSVRVSEYERPGEDGGVVSALYYGLRPITLVGEVRGDSVSAHEAARTALQAACAIEKDTTGFPSAKLLEITTSAGASYFLNVHVKRLVNQIENMTFSRFMISLTAPDPRLYKTGALSSGLISIPTGGGATYPVTYPVFYGATSGGLGSATNSGTVRTYPQLTFRGQLTNPYVQNSTTGLAFQLNRVIAGGETVVADMAQKTIVLNGSSSLLTSKTSESVWWGLEPGINSIKLTTGSASDTGTVEVTWYSAYLGL